MLKRMKCELLIISICFLYLACGSSDKMIQPTVFEYPESKLWAHRVNDTCEAKIRKNEFVGLELDLYYSSI